MTETRLLAADFRTVVELSASHELAAEDARTLARRAILEGVAQVVAEDKERALSELPKIVGAAMKSFGWLWNGFYVLRDDGALHLGPSCGPPVCTPLESSGGVLSSGMCFDALHLNQTLVAYEAKAWPGYVSCDSTSGLGTVSGIVCPVRDEGGRPIAVWDLDATQRVEPADVRFMDVLIATLSHCTVPTPADF